MVPYSFPFILRHGEYIVEKYSKCMKSETDVGLEGRGREKPLTMSSCKICELSPGNIKQVHWILNSVRMTADISSSITEHYYWQKPDI